MRHTYFHPAIPKPDRAFAELTEQQRLDTWHVQLFAKDMTNRRVKPLVHVARHRAAFVWRNDTAGCVE